jgi:hypothetical protein
VSFQTIEKVEHIPKNNTKTDLQSPSEGQEKESENAYHESGQMQLFLEQIQKQINEELKSNHSDLK